jgi:hypothetical protein
VFGVLVVVAAAGKLLLFLPLNLAGLVVEEGPIMRSGFMQAHCQPLFQ